MLCTIDVLLSFRLCTCELHKEENRKYSCKISILLAPRDEFGYKTYAVEAQTAREGSGLALLCAEAKITLPTRHARVL